jgi:hypothetical protein
MERRSDSVEILMVACLTVLTLVQVGLTVAGWLAI